MLEYLIMAVLLLGLVECRGRDLRYHSSYYYYFSSYDYYSYSNSFYYWSAGGPCIVITIIMLIFTCKVCCVSRFEYGQVVTSCSWTCKKKVPKYAQPDSVYQRAVQRGLVDLSAQHRLQPVLQPVALLQPVTQLTPVAAAGQVMPMAYEQNNMTTVMNETTPLQGQPVPLGQPMATVQGQPGPVQLQPVMQGQPVAGQPVPGVSFYPPAPQMTAPQMTTHMAAP